MCDGIIVSSYVSINKNFWDWVPYDCAFHSKSNLCFTLLELSREIGEGLSNMYMGLVIAGVEPKFSEIEKKKIN